MASYYEVYINAGNQSETLTGRIGIWALILEKALEQPWIGHGFHSVWKVIPPFGPDQFEPRHAHNELLQQFYAYGVAGIPLVDSRATFLRPSHYGEEIEIISNVTAVGRSSFGIAHKLFNGGALAVQPRQRCSLSLERGFRQFQLQTAQFQRLFE